MPSSPAGNLLRDADGAAPGAEWTSRTQPANKDAIGYLCAREITLIYDPRTKTLQADSPGAVTTVIGHAS